MGVNVPLLRKYVEWVEEQDKLTENREWFQTNWVTRMADWFERRDETPALDFCDTAYCLAGKVVVDHGWEPIFNVLVLDDSLTATTSSMVVKDGVERQVSDVAEEILGINRYVFFDGDENVKDLFAYNNDAEDIRMIAEELAGERL